MPSALAVAVCVLALLTACSGRLPAQSNAPSLSSTIGSDTPTTIDGKVINAITGAPVPRALVQLDEHAMLTDQEGRFSFRSIEAASNGSNSSLNLRVTKPGYYGDSDGNAMLMTSVAPAQLTAPVTLKIYPEALITGTLTSTDGTPLPHVLVSAQRSIYSERGHQWIPIGQHMTDSRGMFRLTVPAGDYRVETGFMPRFEGSSQGIIPSIYPSITSSDTSEYFHVGAGTEERINLHPLVSPTYMVTMNFDRSSGQGGIPLLTARSTTGAMIPANYTRTPTSGGGVVHLPLGTYTLIASQNFGGATEYGETTVTVTGANTPPATLHLATLPAIPVEVVVDSAATSDKTPPSVQQLGLLLSSSQPSSLGRQTSFGIINSRDGAFFLNATPGTYRLIGLAAGEWFVRAATYGGTDLLQHELIIAQGSGSAPIRLTVSDQTGSLAGTAKLNGVPAATWVYLIPSGPSANPVYTVRSSAAGAFNFAHLPPGAYRAIAFETRHQDDYRSPQRFSRYATWIRNATVMAGNRASLELEAIPDSEMQP